MEWIDCVSDSGWATDKEFDRMKLAKPVNEGWLYSKDKESVKLFASYDKDEDGYQFGDRTYDSSGLGKEDSEDLDGSHQLSVRSHLRSVSFLLLVLVLTYLLVSSFYYFSVYV